MGFKIEAKQKMAVGKEVQVIKGGMEYAGVVEKNTLISGEHGQVESDSVLVLRNDTDGVHYIIPLGYKLDFVLVAPIVKTAPEKPTASEE